MKNELRERIARAIWAKRPDCANKPWPLTDDYSRRAYKHNPIAAVDLCYAYADAALEVMASITPPQNGTVEIFPPWTPM